MRRALTAVAMALAMSACATAPRPYPSLQGEAKPPLVVAGKVVGVRWLAQFPDCFRPETICLDGPPFELVIEVESVIYGELPGRRLVVATTSHYGARMYQARPQPLRLFNVVTDGIHYIMPRYDTVPLVRDVKGVPVLPVLGRAIDSWLPCAIVDLRRPTEFPATLEYDASPWKDDDPELLVIDGNTVRPRSGIYLPDLREWFAKTQPKREAMACSK